MLEVAQFMAHVGGFAWEPAKVLPRVSQVPARALRLENYGLEVGNEADLVVLDAKNWRDTLQLQAVKNAVVLRGRIVAKTIQKQTRKLALVEGQ